jgi:hypothetical protein
MTAIAQQQKRFRLFLQFNFEVARAFYADAVFSFGLGCPDDPGRRLVKVPSVQLQCLLPIRSVQFDQHGGVWLRDIGAKVLLALQLDRLRASLSF